MDGAGHGAGEEGDAPLVLASEHGEGRAQRPEGFGFAGLGVVGDDEFALVGDGAVELGDGGEDGDLEVVLGLIHGLERAVEGVEKERPTREPLIDGKDHALRRGPDLPVVPLQRSQVPARKSLPRRRTPLRRAYGRLARGDR